jgi:4-aminobutyrate aminotransferase/(S)-3-amino-2-methylpropionate transaminase
MGVTVGRRELIDKFEPNYHGVTYGGNPVGSAIALAVIKLLQEEKLPEHAAELGEYFFKELKELESEHQLIGHIDAMGFMIGIELVKDRKTKEPASEETMRVIKEAIKRGLILTISGYYGNRINIVPPLITQREQIDAAIAILGESLHTAEH